jgi:hypothetical protein
LASFVPIRWKWSLPCEGAEPGLGDPVRAPADFAEPVFRIGAVGKNVVKAARGLALRCGIFHIAISGVCVNFGARKLLRGNHD